MDISSRNETVRIVCSLVLHILCGFYGKKRLNRTYALLLCVCENRCFLPAWNPWLSYVAIFFKLFVKIFALRHFFPLVTISQAQPTESLCYRNCEQSYRGSWAYDACFQTTPMQQIATSPFDACWKILPVARPCFTKTALKTLLCGSNLWLRLKTMSNGLYASRWFHYCNLYFIVNLF